MEALELLPSLRQHFLRMRYILQVLYIHHSQYCFIRKVVLQTL